MLCRSLLPVVGPSFDLLSPEKWCGQFQLHKGILRLVRNKFRMAPLCLLRRSAWYYYCRTLWDVFGKFPHILLTYWNFAIIEFVSRQSHLTVRQARLHRSLHKDAYHGLELNQDLD